MPDSLRAGDVEVVERVEMLTEGVIPGDFLAHCFCLVDLRTFRGLSMLMRRDSESLVVGFLSREEWWAYDVSNTHDL